MAAMGGRPMLMQRFPDGRRRAVVLPEAGARQRPRLARDDDRQHGQRHAVAGACGGRRRPPDLGGQPRLPRLPRVAVPRRRPATTSTSCASTSIPSRAPASPRRCEAAGELRDAARRARHRRPPQDDRQAAASTSTSASSRAGLLRGAGGGGGRRPRARAPPPRPPHRRLVEGGAGQAHLRRLQPERAPQDGVRRLVGAGPGRGPGVDAGDVGRAGRGPPRRADDRDRCPARVAGERRPVGGDGRRAPVDSSRCSPCPSATWPTGSWTPRGRPSTRRCPTSRPGSRPAGPATRRGLTVFITNHALAGAAIGAVVRRPGPGVRPRPGLAPGDGHGAALGPGRASLGGVRRGRPRRRHGRPGRLRRRAGGGAPAAPPAPWPPASPAPAWSTWTSRADTSSAVRRSRPRSTGSTAASRTRRRWAGSSRRGRPRPAPRWPGAGSSAPLTPLAVAAVGTVPRAVPGGHDMAAIDARDTLEAGGEVRHPPARRPRGRASASPACRTR